MMTLDLSCRTCPSSSPIALEICFAANRTLHLIWPRCLLVRLLGLQLDFRGWAGVFKVPAPAVPDTPTARCRISAPHTLVRLFFSLHSCSCKSARSRVDSLTRYVFLIVDFLPDLQIATVGQANIRYACLPDLLPIPHCCCRRQVSSSIS